MKQTIFSCPIIFFALLLNFSCFAQSDKGEYKTSAGSEYSSFDTSQSVIENIPVARRFGSADMLQLQLSGNPKEVKSTVYNYFRLTDMNGGKTQIWGVREEHNIKIQAGRIISAKMVTYSILNMPPPRSEKGFSYKPADYKKDNLKMSEVSGDEALVIDFFRYSQFLDSESKLTKDDGYFKYFYNDKGDCIRMVHDDRQFRYFYKYDGQNNWIQRFLWDSDDGITQRIDRKIIY